MPEDFAQFIGRANSFDDSVRAKRGDGAGNLKDAERTGANAINE